MSANLLRRALLAFALIGLGAFAAPGRAIAQPGYGPPPGPSPFHYAWQGMLLGATDGLAVGYLVASDRGTWEPYVYGAGIGAIAGGVLGLTVGIADMHSPGAAYFVLRDATYGSTFGLLVGGISGGLIGRDGESIATGAAIGVLAGTAVGAVIGFIERLPQQAANDRSWRLAVAAARDGAEHTVWMPALVGRY